LSPDRAVLAVEGRNLTVRLTDVLRAKTNLIYLDDEVMRLRSVKTPEEVELIRRNARLAVTGFNAAREIVATRGTELELFTHVWREMCRELGRVFTLRGDFTAGVATADLGGPPTMKSIRGGENILVDLGILIDGYWADVTRNFIAGKPTSRQSALHSILQDAIESGYAMLRPGASVASVYFAVRNVIAKAGYGEYFLHPAGHGLGLSVHEHPDVAPYSRDTLVEGMVVTLEPGIYIPGEGGMRLEDDFVVCNSGGERLSTSPLGLIECS
jgi:Xaa-Pro aminopeptidase